MLRVAILFFVLGLVAYLLGLNGLAGVSIDLGKLLLGAFFVIAVISLILSAISGRRPKELI